MIQKDAPKISVFIFPTKNHAYLYKFFYIYINCHLSMPKSFKSKQKKCANSISFLSFDFWYNPQYPHPPPFPPRMAFMYSMPVSCWYVSHVTRHAYTSSLRVNDRPTRILEPYCPKPPSVGILRTSRPFARSPFLTTLYRTRPCSQNFSLYVESKSCARRLASSARRSLMRT